MIRNIYKISLMALLASCLFATVYEYDYSFTDAVFKQKNGHMLVEIPGCMQIGVEGEPLLPNYPIKILLPPGETLDNAEIVINKTKNYPLMLPILPKQADRPLSWGVSDNGFMKKEAVYSLDQYNKDNIHVNVHWFRGAGVVIGTIDPLTYFPRSGNVELAESITLRVTTKSKPHDVKIQQTDIDILQTLVQNPGVLSSYSDITSDQLERLLIITSNEFKPACDTLMNHYKKYGIISQIISPSDIEHSDIPGRDIQEKIRNTILYKYLEKDLDYILIGGNSDIVPHRGLYCSVLTGGYWETSYDIPADLYYAALDGNWDKNGNNVFGEYNDTTGLDEADLFPELAVGRMPVSNLEELKNMISKSIRYQAEPVIEDIDKHLFLGEFLYRDPWSLAADYLELLIGEHDDNGYTTQGLPEHLRTFKWYDMSDTNSVWNFATVKEELANGMAFVHHDGHANTSYMMKFYTSQINDSDFTQVNGIDHTTPIFYSHGCNCGGFDYPACIASRLVSGPYISVGGLFNSRFGWFNEGQTEGPSIHLHREFENAIYGHGFYQLGWAQTVSRIATAPWVTAMGQWEQNALRWNFYTINILGDPVMRMFTDTPSDAQVNWDITDIKESQLRASVLIDTDPVKNAGVAVIDTAGILIGFGMTDISGYVDITLSSPVLAGDSVSCYVSGENILLKETTLVSLESDIHDPESFTLLESYPNPFNPHATIAYSLAQDGKTDIRVYDVQGKLVDVLFHGFQTAGSHKLLFKANNLSSGVYICRLQIADITRTQKLILLK